MAIRGCAPNADVRKLDNLESTFATVVSTTDCGAAAHYAQATCRATARCCPRCRKRSLGAPSLSHSSRQASCLRDANGPRSHFSDLEPMAFLDFLNDLTHCRTSFLAQILFSPRVPGEGFRIDRHTETLSNTPPSGAACHVRVTFTWPTRRCGAARCQEGLRPSRDSWWHVAMYVTA